LGERRMLETQETAPKARQEKKDWYAE
jgi:hypothetical protein